MANIVEYWHWILWAALVGVCYLVMRVISGETPTKYHARGKLYSRGILKLWQALAAACDDDWLVLPRVELGRLMEVRRARGRRNGSVAIDQWVLDFVIIDSGTGLPQVAIQVIEESEETDDQDDRDDDRAEDAELDKLRLFLEQIEVPLLVVERQKSYDVEELNAVLEEAIIGEPPRKRRKRSA